MAEIRASLGFQAIDRPQPDPYISENTDQRRLIPVTEKMKSVLDSW
jgi:hypothetical protein